MENDGENVPDINIIQSLPYDIILLVLDYTSTTDIICFGRTCKQFYELVKSSHVLWKNKIRQTVNESVFEEMERKSNGNWYNELRHFFKLQSEVYSHVIDMGSHYYKCDKDITLDEVRQFFKTSFTDGFSYYCTIYILQQIVKTANRDLFVRVSRQPFTLTDMYYSKVVLQHMIHHFMAIKWVQLQMTNALPPEIVLNFFLQWVDPLNLHTDEKINDAISSIANMVEAELKKRHPSKTQRIVELCETKQISETQIVAAVSHVMYKEKRMTPVYIANLETLNMKKVIELGCGGDVVIAAVYHAVARRFGVQCELIAFPNHLFLELRSSQDGSELRYKIELDSGKLSPKRSCPFSRNNPTPSSYKYSPDSLLQYVISSFLMPMGGYETWHMKNAIYLLDLLTINPNNENKYTNILPYLHHNTHLPAMFTSIDLRRLTENHLLIITLLSYLTKTPTLSRQHEPVVPNKRTSEVKYAVGMIVQHTMYSYMGVVREWERRCRPEVLSRPDVLNLEFGYQQPFYVVEAVDQSRRYIAQEHLTFVGRPNRMFHLEDIISREFTHFNGFAYEPNAYKQIEYPDDLAVSEQYRIRAAAVCGTAP